MIAITGATGQLGHHVLQELLKPFRQPDCGDVRNPAKPNP
ncbi:Quinone oxidoreductase 2 [Raoultella terrigena]|uniref:Quinone oxidoreductase 2 n=1 Tax=Raoultella terrigena TaxID=577 RepID=A0A4U9D6Y6_RAOTE|nr:Quinone oxidoreductase 2 [Raoultella terrigena]